MNIVQAGKKILSALLICFACSTVAVARSHNGMLLQKIDKAKGLSDNNIQCIYKDDNGFMWIGTQSGLNLLDGSGITAYANKVNGVHSGNKNSITAITGNDHNHLWIGTLNGLNIFDKTTGIFFPVQMMKNEQDKAIAISGFAYDQKNNLFIATNSGLYFLGVAGKKFSFLPVPGIGHERMLNNNITHIACDGKGKIWLSTYNGLWDFNEATQKFEQPVPALNDSKFSALFTCFIIDHTGKLWIGTWDAGLKEYDPATGNIITHPLPRVMNIYNLAEINKRNEGYRIWINGSNTVYDAGAKQFNYYQKGDPGASASPATVVRQFGSSEVWIGTHDGIFFYNPGKADILCHRFSKPITSQSVSICQWKDKILVSGSDSHFLKAYNAWLNEVTDYSNISAGQISCLYIQPLGEDAVRCGTTAGIADINLSDHSYSLKRLSVNAPGTSVKNFVTYLLRDAEGLWWFFPWRNGIWNTDTPLHQPRKAFNNFLSDYGVPKPLVISCGIEDDHHNLWLGDLDEGFIFYDRKNNSFSKPFVKDIGEWSTVTQIAYHQKHCYSFIENNLFTWNTDSAKLQKIRMPPTADKDITSVAFDSAGHVWIATLNGLFCYHTGNHSFTHFSMADGLPSDELNGTLYCCSDGAMIFGCPDFLFSFDPAKILASADYRPALKLAAVKVGDKAIVFDTLKPPRFSYTQNNFDIRWAVTDYNNPLQNHYYYKLEGIDKDWKYTGQTGRVAFASLSPGRYSLLLKGFNSNDIEAANMLRLSFSISPPFWETWWFFALLSFLLASVVYSFYQYRLGQLLKIERLRNKISMNLHDDIGSTLSSIAILSDIALQHTGETGTGSSLKEIKDNSHSLMEKMDDIVWSINPKNDTLENLMLRIKRIASKLFEAKDIDYTIEITDNISPLKISMENRQHLYLLIKEALNNIVKHADCSFTSITAVCRNDLLVFAIKDNGKGFDTSRNSDGNGLYSMAQRAKEMNAALSIISGPGRGTEIMLHMKIK